MKAASPFAANAYGLIAFIPCASRIVPSGTNQMAIAAAWMKNKIISSAYSALRNVLNIGAENSQSASKIKARNLSAARELSFRFEAADYF